MSETKFKFDKNIPAEILRSIQKNLSALEFLIPAWCHEVNVEYLTDGALTGVSENCLADSHIHYQYRNGALAFYPGYMAESESERMNTCIHEMLHLTVNILYYYSRGEIIDLTEGKDELQKHILDEQERRLESVISDLAYSLQKRFAVG